MLDIRNLHKTFGGVVALNQLNFQVEAGTVTAIIGPNGAGKTTIFNIITGFIKPSQGDLFFNRQSINGLKPHEIARLQIARTFQQVQVFSNMSALENVMVGRHTRSRGGMLNSCLLPTFFRKEEKRIQVDAHHWLAYVNMEEHAHKPAGSLPLGQQRMLEIARALSMEPELLLLDEPASGLNTRETIAMGELILRIREMGITVIIVEHDMELVMDISDKVVVINFGFCIASGAPKEIQSNPEVIAAYLGEE
jgi:branched-chain amino acid transport system ATP-binding protein